MSDASPPEQRSLSRRDFLKIAGFGAAGAGAAIVASKTKPIAEAINRLSFNPDILLGSEPLLDSDIEIIKERLDGMDTLLGFQNTEVWNKSVEQSITVLKDMASLCKDLNRSSEEFALASGDLHELKTTIWLLLKVKDDFVGRSEELQQLIKTKQISEYIFSHYGKKVTTEWMYDSVTRHFYNPDDESLVDYLFTTPEFLGDYASYFFPWFPSEEYRQEKIEEYGKTQGAKVTEIEGDITENDRARIMQQLEDQRLSKVARSLSFFKNEYDVGSQSHGFVTLGLSEQELKGLFSGGQEWQAFQLHEIGHVVWDIVKLIPDSGKRLELRTELYGSLERFNPTKNLNTYLHPQGEFKTISNGETFLDNILNEASITQYPSGYFLYDLEYEGKYLLKALLANSALTDIVITVSDVNAGITDEKVIADRKLTPLENELVKRGKAILIEVERSERKPETASIQGTQSTDNSRKLLEVGIPLAMLDMIQNHRSEFTELVLKSSPRFSGEHINRLIDGYLLSTQESLESTAGEELFAELFQATFRRNNPEVQNQMEDDRLEQFQGLIDNIMDNLIKNKLAKRESTQAVI